MPTPYQRCGDPRSPGVTERCNGPLGLRDDDDGTTTTSKLLRQRRPQLQLRLRSVLSFIGQLFWLILGA